MAKSERNLNAVFTDTANAIRAKKESVELISPVDFADEIATIETGVNPEGTLEITENGTYDVTLKANAHVNVPNPSIGNKQITTTEQVNVTDFATAQVVDANLVAENIKKDVSILGVVGTNEGYPEPAGTLDITVNGTYDVKDKASANVNVAGVQPTGTLEITGNGAYDVTDKASAEVNVPYLLNVEADRRYGWGVEFLSRDNIHAYPLENAEFTYDASNHRVDIKTNYDPDVSPTIFEVQCNNSSDPSEWYFYEAFLVDQGEDASWRFALVMDMTRNVLRARLTADSNFAIVFNDLPEGATYSKAEYLQFLKDHYGCDFYESMGTQTMLCLCDVMGQRITLPSSKTMADMVTIIENYHQEGSGSGSGSGSDSEE